MECDICLLEWDSISRIPRLLNCGHTFCEVCLKEILIKSQSNSKQYTCPTCLTEQRIKSFEDIDKLIKNFNLLRITEKVVKRKGMSPTGRDTINNKDLHFDITQAQLNFTKSITSIKDIKNKIPFDFNKRCLKHNLPIHSYVTGTNILICNECLKETKFNVSLLPNAINDLKIILDSNGARVCLLKNQIERLQLFFESYLSEFEKANSKKIEELFNYFYQIIKYYHNSANQMLQQCICELKQQVNDKLTEINGLLQELNSLDKEVNKYMKDSNSQLLQNIDRIKHIEKKLTNFINYDLEFDLLTMNIGLNFENIDHLVKVIEQGYHLDVEFLLINNSNPTIGQIVKSDTCWTCLCGDLSNNYNEIKCNSCGLYRRYETIPSFFSQPDLISDEELYFVSIRKKTEEEEYKNLRFNIDINQSAYYAIDAEWLNEWQIYVTNNIANADKKFRLSSNKRIGVLPPGPIPNYNLLKTDNNTHKEELKKNMTKDKDYHIINKDVWCFFYKNYNGGPEIQLINPNDIYDNKTIINSLNERETKNENNSFSDDIIDNFDEDLC